MTGKVVAVEGCDQAGFEPLSSLFMRKASMLTHFMVDTGFVVFQEEAEADAALMELDGHTVGTLVLTVRRPTATEEDLLGQMLRVKWLEELVTLLRLSSPATGLANTLFALSKLQPRPPPLLGRPNKLQQLWQRLHQHQHRQQLHQNPHRPVYRPPATQFQSYHTSLAARTARTTHP